MADVGSIGGAFGESIQVRTPSRKRIHPVLRPLLACLVGVAIPGAQGAPVPVGNSTTTVSYTTTHGDESYSVSLDYKARNVTDAVSLVGAPNIWSFNSVNAFGRRAMLAQRGFSVFDAAAESMIAHAFFKGVNGDDYFPGITADSNVTIRVSGITLDQPVFVDGATVMLHALWKAEQVDCPECLPDPYIHVDNHHTAGGVYRDFDDFVSGSLFLDSPAPTYRVPDKDVSFVVSGNGTTVIDLEVTFPYALLMHFEETGQSVPKWLPAPHGFLEPFHFHLEYVLTRRLLVLPPVPVPAENTITEPKRILGKILFWDEQLSSNNKVACGTCHRVAAGGSDPRFGRNPGFDGVFNTADDVLGSFGVPRADAGNTPYKDAVYGWDPQVTGRTAPMMIGSQYSPELFWDGRAGSTFYNPETGLVSITSGGALEFQATGPIMSDGEMAHDDRDWASVAAKLNTAVPLELATDLPPDVAAALASRGNYPDLFAAAFGDPTITAERIAFAIATYERTLYPDQTPWDRYMAGETDAMTPDQILGWEFFQTSECHECHVPPLFTDRSYRNIGLRPVAEDPGRRQVTGLDDDRGKFKVPTLRNVGLKTKFMHHGRITRLQDVVAYYIGAYSPQFPDNLDPLIPPIEVPLPMIAPLVDFMENGLADSRVVSATSPFDQPTLRGERMAEFPAFADCMFGPGSDPTRSSTVAETCADLFDTDGDGDVDLGDYRSLLWAFPGP